MAAFDSEISQLEFLWRRWARDLMSMDLHGTDVAIALVTHGILSNNKLNKIKAAPLSRRNDMLLAFVDEKCRASKQGAADVWDRFSECVGNLQPALAFVPRGDLTDLLAYQMKQWHQSWLDKRIIDVITTRRFDLDDFVHPRILVFCRQSFLRDVPVTEILERPKNTIGFRQLFDKGDDLLDPNHNVTKILLRGKQGFGKTTLASYMVQEYSNGNLWCDSVMLILFCGELNNITKDLAFVELIEAFHGPCLPQSVWKCVWEELIPKHHRIILILDGLESFEGFGKEDLVNRQAIVDPFTRCSLTDLLVNIMNGTMLPNMKVLATSRGDCLRDIFMFHRVAELGFFKEQQKTEFSRNFAAGDTELEESLKKMLLDKDFGDLCRQPTVCRFAGKYLRRLGNTSGQPELINITYTKVMIDLIYHLIRYHHPRVRSNAPYNIPSMVASVRTHIIETANLAVQWMCTHANRQYLTEEELYQHQMKNGPEVLESGFLSILTTRDFKKIAHFWFINQTYRAFFAAIGIIQKLGEQPIEDYVDNKYFKKSLLFLAGLLCNKDGLRFLKCLFPEKEDYPAKITLIQVTDMLCNKLVPLSEDDKMFLIHLAHESQLPDVINIVKKVMADGDLVLRVNIPEPRTIMDKTALQHFRNMLESSEYKLRMQNEATEDVERTLDDTESEVKTFASDHNQPPRELTEGLLPPCILPLEGLFTSILCSMDLLRDKHCPSQLQREVSLEELNGNGHLIAEIFAKQSRQVFHHVNKLLMFITRKVDEYHKDSSRDISSETLSAEAREMGILLYEAVKACLIQDPNKDIFIQALPCFQIQ